jgi:phosphoribosylglycinamide formyltransferase-1
LKNLIDRIRDGRLDASIVHVVASRPDIAAIGRAQAAAIRVSVATRKGKSLEAFSEEVFAPIRGAAADLVVLGGFLSLIQIPPDYAGRVLNVHPSLLPAFGGQGYHGAAVHAAALEAGVKVSGCTVHFADDTYDTGPIILQRVVPVLPDDSPPILAARVFAAECDALPEAIALYADARLRVEGRTVRILDPVRE